MPHPVININEVILKTATQYKTNRVSGYSLTRGYNRVSGVTYRQEPESTSNPIRKDGTRAPAAYFIKTIYFTMPRSPFAAVSKFNNWDFLPKGEVSTWWLLFGAGANAAFAKLHTDNTRVKDRARVAFHNKLGDTSGKDQISLGVMAGEFRETCGMVADLADGLVHGVLSIARDVRKPGRLVSDVLSVYGTSGRKAALKQLGGTDAGMLKGIIDGWLVYQLGLKPLMYDLDDATKTLNAQIQGQDGLEYLATIRAGAEDVKEFDMLTQSEGLQGCPVDVWTRFTESQQAHIAAVYKIPIRPTTLQKLGLYNVPYVGWELVRYSWMADYVSNAGPWLRSLLAGQDCSFIEGSMSVLGKTTVVKRWIDAKGRYVVTTDPTNVQEILSSDLFERTVLNGVRPAFMPHLNNRLNATRVASSLAALTNLIGSRSRNGEIPIIKY